jgi:hypothetical protein
MPEFNIRSDSVNVEQIMDQIRARIREKRGVDYTDEQIREMATVKLEKFLDPRGVRSDLLEQFRRAQPPYSPPELPNFAFEEQTLFESHRAPLRWIRRLLLPILKLFFNPNPLIQALNIQSRLNTMSAEREARREAARHGIEQLQYEVLHNLVVETTRLGIEVKNLKMRVESLTSRLEFNERRARALESVVVYQPAPDARAEAPNARARPAVAVTAPEENVNPKAMEPAAVPAAAAEGAAGPAEGPGQRSRRRRRRRGRRGGAPAAALMGAQPPGVPGSAPTGQDASDVRSPDEEAHEGDAPAPDEPDAPAGSEPETQ